MASFSIDIGVVHALLKESQIRLVNLNNVQGASSLAADFDDVQLDTTAVSALAIVY